MSLFQYGLAGITCSGSLFMNLGGRWKLAGVVCGLIAGPLWMFSEYSTGSQGGMLFSSFVIWLTYFVGLWKVRQVQKPAPLGQVVRSIPVESADRVASLWHQFIKQCNTSPLNRAGVEVIHRHEVYDPRINRAADGGREAPELIPGLAKALNKDAA